MLLASRPRAVGISRCPARRSECDAHVVEPPALRARFCWEPAPDSGSGERPPVATELAAPGRQRVLPWLVGRGRDQLTQGEFDDVHDGSSPFEYGSTGTVSRFRTVESSGYTYLCFGACGTMRTSMPCFRKYLSECVPCAWAKEREWRGTPHRIVHSIPDIISTDRCQAGRAERERTDVMT